MSKAILITYRGETNTKAGWAAKIGISREALHHRLLAGWSVAEAVTTPRHRRTPKKYRKALASPKQPNQQAQTTTAFPPFEELKRQHLATQRQFNSLLRQFNRDLHALMGRGVVVDLPENANDRLSPVTRGLS